jgi:hypothetical protein
MPSVWGGNVNWSLYFDPRCGRILHASFGVDSTGLVPTLYVHMLDHRKTKQTVDDLKAWLTDAADDAARKLREKRDKVKPPL